MEIKLDEEIKLLQLQSSDSKDIFKVIDNEREYLGKWLPFIEHTKDVSDTDRFVKSIVNAPKDKFEYIFTIQKSNKFIGLIGFKRTDRVNKRTEIGYWLSEEYQKQGIVTKSVVELCDFAFYSLNINRIQIKCAIDNIASINIPKTLGFTFEGIERDGELLTGNIFTDLEVYSKLKSDK